MAVLIQDMKMPEGCRSCRLMDDCDSCEGYECFCVALQKNIGHLNEVPEFQRRDDCPLIEI